MLFTESDCSANNQTRFSPQYLFCPHNCKTFIWIHSPSKTLIAVPLRGQMITYTLTAVEGTVLEYQRANDYLYTYCSRGNCPGVSEGK